MGWMRLAFFLALTLLCGACSSVEDGAGSRPFVITSASKLGDLYWRGELTDSKGRRWNVWIIPGVGTSLEVGAEAFVDAYDFAKGPGEKEFWIKRGEDVQDGVEFAVDDCLGEFLLEGIAEDYVSTGENISANIEETPFGWIPRIMGNVLWGYVLCPAGRLVLAPIGMAGGFGYSLVVPTGQVVARPVGGVTWIVLAGVATPTVRIGLHQPIYLFSLFNREPSADQDGQFGLEIIDWGKNGPPRNEVIPQEIPPDPFPKPAPPEPSPRKREWTERDHERAYREREDYRRAYDYGYRQGLKQGRREAYQRAQQKSPEKEKVKKSDKND